MGAVRVRAQRAKILTQNISKEHERLLFLHTFGVDVVFAHACTEVYCLALLLPGLPESSDEDLGTKGRARGGCAQLQ